MQACRSALTILILHVASQVLGEVHALGAIGSDASEEFEDA